MGKGSSAPPPPDPYKTASAEAQFNRLDTYSPSGSGQRFGYTDPKTGQFVQGLAPEGSQSAVKAIESPWETMTRTMLQPASLALTDRIIKDNIVGLPEAPRAQERGTVADSIYNRTLSMIRPDMEKANTRILTNLQARGLPVGSEAFNETMTSQQRNTEDTLSRLAMDADMAAGQEQSRQFSLDQSSRQGAIAELVAAMGGNYNPPNAAPSGQAAGVNYSGLVGQQYQNQLAQHNASQQAKAQTASAAGSALGAMFLKSDRRFKRDIVLIGRRGPLNLYQYRYLWDAPGTVRRGYMAQEVVKVFPRAVFWALGYMVLDYDQLPEVG